VGDAAGTGAARLAAGTTSGFVLGSSAMPDTGPAAGSARVAALSTAGMLGRAGSAARGSGGSAASPAADLAAAVRTPSRARAGRSAVCV